MSKNGSFFLCQAVDSTLLYDVKVLYRLVKAQSWLEEWTQICCLPSLYDLTCFEEAWPLVRAPLWNELVWRAIRGSQFVLVCDSCVIRADFIGKMSLWWFAQFLVQERLLVVEACSFGLLYVFAHCLDPLHSRGSVHKHLSLLFLESVDISAIPSCLNDSTWSIPFSYLRIRCITLPFLL